jgi:hypothetical protein
MVNHFETVRVQCTDSTTVIDTWKAELLFGYARRSMTYEGTVMELEASLP